MGGAECILLSEISRSEKDKYHMISLMWSFRNNNKKMNTGERKKERETNHKIDSDL